MPDYYLFKSALADLLRPKKLLAALLLIVLPAALALLWKAGAGKTFDPESVYNVIAAGLVFGFGLVILSVVFGTSVLAQEIEQKTITYLLTRPLPRWRILLVKFLATVLVVTVTVWLASILLSVATYGIHKQPHLMRDLEILPIGAFAYSAAFLALSTWVNKPLLWGLLYAFLWESWVPSLPGSFAKASLMAYLRVLAPHTQPASDDGNITGMLSALSPVTISSGLAWGVLIGVILVGIVIALATFSTHEYVPREDSD